MPLAPGWHAYSPADPDLDPEIRALYQSTPRPEPIGEVHIFVHALQAGRSEVQVGVAAEGLTVDALLEAAIRELQAARRVFAE